MLARNLRIVYLFCYYLCNVLCIWLTFPVHTVQVLKLMDDRLNDIAFVCHLCLATWFWSVNDMRAKPSFGFPLACQAFTFLFFDFGQRFSISPMKQQKVESGVEIVYIAGKWHIHSLRGVWGRWEGE